MNRSTIKHLHTPLGGSNSSPTQQEPMGMKQGKRLTNVSKYFS